VRSSSIIVLIDAYLVDPENTGEFSINGAPICKCFPKSAVRIGKYIELYPLKKNGLGVFGAARAVGYRAVFLADVREFLRGEKVAADQVVSRFLEDMEQSDFMLKRIEIGIRMLLLEMLICGSCEYFFRRRLAFCTYVFRDFNSLEAPYMLPGSASLALMLRQGKAKLNELLRQ
jgi:hypothetical protein